MTTSGSYAFALSRDELIAAALRLTQRFGAGDTIPAEDITNCAQALNMLCKALALEGVLLWCYTEVQIPLVAGQATYNLSALLSGGIPTKIVDCFLRNPGNSDVGLLQTSRTDYDLLGQKNAPGVPTTYLYDPQLTGALLTVYAVPTDAASTLHVVVQRQIQDINLATENPDFPQEAYRSLKWMLADEIALEYSTPTGVRQELALKAVAYRDKFFDSLQAGDASVVFTPSRRGM